MRVLSGVAAAAALAVSLSVAAPLPARAHDTLAPPGAPHTWLPHEPWVARHWIPFDVRRLQRVLGLGRRDFYAFLFNDHRTLADLARLRGVEVDELADHLVAPWRAIVDDQRVGVLRDRTLRLLTQGHLAQHVFLHVFHSPNIKTAAVEVLRLSRARLRRLRASGHSVLDIARRRGVSPAALRRGMLRAFRKHRDDGVRRQEAWPAQAASVLANQAAMLPCWMRRPVPTSDSANPFGKAMHQHGAHGAAWPSTARQRRADERRVERVRRSLTRSCWRRPRAWSWSSAIADGLAPGAHSANHRSAKSAGSRDFRSRGQAVPLIGAFAAVTAVLVNAIGAVVGVHRVDSLDQPGAPRAAAWTQERRRDALCTAGLDEDQARGSGQPFLEELQRSRGR